MPVDIEHFFEDYVDTFNRSLRGPVDFNAIQAAYTSSFVAAGPTGILCANNDDEFSEFLENGYAFYRSIGTQSMALLGVEQTPIDANHVMAKVLFSSDYKRDDGSLVTIDFDVTYMLHIQDGVPQIFAYVAGDEQQAFREKGLLPDE